MKYHCDDKYINISLAGLDMTGNETTVAQLTRRLNSVSCNKFLIKRIERSFPAQG